FRDVRLLSLLLLLSSFLLMIPPPPISTLFPYTTLFRSFYFKSPMHAPGLYPEHDLFIQLMKLKNTLRHMIGEELITHLGLEYYEDRKSTRLNSSHLGISYAVFCLKKKKKTNNMYNLHRD